MTSILDNNNVLIPKWLSTLPNNIKVVLVILIGLHVFGVLLVVLLYVAILFIITCILIHHYHRYQRATSKKSFQPFKAKLK